jgi:calcium-dependent protein kinase
MGTAEYIAPEVLKNKYNEKCDIWSIGVILYILLTGEIPFKGKNDHDTFELIKFGYLNFNGQEWKGVSNEAKIFVKKLLTIDPYSRPSAKYALDDPWVKIF